MTTAKRTRPCRPGRNPFHRKPPPSLEELVAERCAPQEAHHLVTARSPQKIVATRWRNDEGRWLYVAEIDDDGVGYDPTMQRPKAAADNPPMYAIFSDNPRWASNMAVRAKMQRMLTDWFPFAWSGFQFAQAMLDQYGSQKRWQRDPPLPDDDDEARPVRRAANHHGHNGHGGGESQISNLKSKAEAGDVIIKPKPRSNRKPQPKSKTSAGGTSSPKTASRAARTRKTAKFAGVDAKSSTALVPASPRPRVPASASPPAATPDLPMSAAEKRDLRIVEKQIRRNLKTGRKLGLETGRLLRKVRDRRWYREKYATFEIYCREEFGFGRQEASDKIEAVRVAAIVSPISDKAKIALVEDHLKALAPLKDAADVRAIYERVVKRTQKDHTPITGKLLREERRRYETPAEDLERRGRGKEETRGCGDAGTRGEAMPPRSKGMFTRGVQDAEALDVPTSKPWRDSWEAARDQLLTHVRTVLDRWRFAPCRQEVLDGLRIIFPELR